MPGRAAHLDGDRQTLRLAISWRAIGKPGLAYGRSPECEPAPCCRRVSAPERHIEGPVPTALTAAPIPPVLQEARARQGREIARRPAKSLGPQCCRQA